MIKYTVKTMMCIIFLGTLMASCYRMPTEDNYSLTPVTNNPRMTGAKTSLMPAAKF